MHPFVSDIRERYQGMILFCSDEEIKLKFCRNRDKREIMILHFDCLGGEDDVVDINFQAQTRYPLIGVMHEKYFTSLSECLAAHSMTLRAMPPRTIELQGFISPDSCPEFESWEEASDYTDYLIHDMASVLQTATFITHLNHRLPERGGSVSYRKLLPSRLAALTMCGFNNETLFH